MLVAQPHTKAESLVIISVGQRPVVFGRKCKTFIINDIFFVIESGIIGIIGMARVCPVRDKILVEKRLKSQQRAVRYAILAKNKFNIAYLRHAVLTHEKPVSTNIKSLTGFLPNTNRRCPALLILPLCGIIIRLFDSHTFLHTKNKKTPLLKAFFCFVAPTGIEPVTQGFSVLCSTY